MITDHRTREAGGMIIEWENRGVAFNSHTDRRGGELGSARWKFGGTPPEPLPLQSAGQPKRRSTREVSDSHLGRNTACLEIATVLSVAQGNVTNQFMTACYQTVSMLSLCTVARHFVASHRNWEESRENCVMISLMIYATHKILFGRSNWR